MTNYISYDVFLIDNDTGLENTYSLSFESPFGILENIQFRASEENAVNKAIECLGYHLVILSDIKSKNINQLTKMNNYKTND